MRKWSFGLIRSVRCTIKNQVHNKVELLKVPQTAINNISSNLKTIQHPINKTLNLQVLMETNGTKWIKIQVHKLIFLL